MSEKKKRKEKLFFIWGNSGHARVIFDLLKKKKYKIIAILDDNLQSKKIFKDTPLIKGRKKIDLWIKKNKKILTGVVAVGDNCKRLKILKLLKNYKVDLSSIYHNQTIISVTAKIHDGCQILGGSVIGPNATIGFGSIVNHNAVVDHDAQIGIASHIAPSATVCGNVKIGNKVLVGANSVLLPGSFVPNKKTIKAGSIYKKKT